jgi:hypothetical protein
VTLKAGLESGVLTLAFGTKFLDYDAEARDARTGACTFGTIDRMNPGIESVRKKGSRIYSERRR